MVRLFPRRAARAIALVWLGLQLAPAAQARCDEWNPLAGHQRSRSRPVVAEDLINLVNFGRPDAEPVGGASPFAVSPDGRIVAMILARADLATNGYCQALVTIDLSGRRAPKVLDRGGDYLMTVVTMRGMFIPNGFPQLNRPAWSADGRSIAYLRRDKGRTQLWRVSVDDGGGAPVTQSAVDVEAWTWAADGHSLIYATAPGRIAAEAAVDQEGLAGWHYDERTLPPLGARPRILAPLEQETIVVDPHARTFAAATAADLALLAREREDPLDRRRLTATGKVAWAEPSGPSPLAPLRLRALERDKSPFPCTVAACTGAILGLWWDDVGRRLTFLRREGWNGRLTALYRWSPGKDQPRRLIATDDLLAGCAPAGRALLCVRESATKPPRLVSLDLANGGAHLVFDPNPGFRRLTIGGVERIEWRNDLGFEVYGDLVLPPGFRRGTTLPTIVVQYSSRGFLRGGTGNEYPIYLLAGRGFAVLSIQKPAMYAAHDPTLTTFEEVSALNTKDWAERRSVNSAIERGVRLLIARGIADPARIGITGLSDGASAARFALINSPLFAAGAISSCCVDELSDALEGPAWSKYSREIGYPPPYPVDTASWRPYSLALNANRVATPLLMQLADSEVLTALPSYAALRAYDRPVDLYAFPDEYHIKWQPRHRWAVFDRNLDWFSFWLQGVEDPAPAKAPQYKRWRALRGAHGRASPSRP